MKHKSTNAWLLKIYDFLVLQSKISNSKFNFILPLVLLLTCNEINAQQIALPVKNSVSSTLNPQNLFGTEKNFIENTGQYGDLHPQYPQMGKILYAYEGFNVPVLFTAKGLIHLQQKVRILTAEEREREERREHRKHKTDEFEETESINRSITMEWLNSNPNVEIIATDKSSAYHTYGLSSRKAGAFKKIEYKNLYQGIDLIYTFTENNKIGFEYSLVIQPGADFHQIKMRYGGELQKIKRDENGNITLKSKAGSISISVPVIYSGNSLQATIDSSKIIRSSYSIDKNIISFTLPEGFDQSKGFVIDPFISGTGNMTGTNAGIAKDVDFDYSGNVYVTGGGNGSVYKLAKFDAAGVLQWTFSGTLTIPAWTFGTYYGGWVVDKNTGNIYLGQGFAPSGGHRIIRINTTGVYDNYITTANPSFLENWKMYWSCNNGSPQILIAGGGTNSNINFGICSPPSTVITAVNVTGIPYSVSTGWAQDISDIVIDPVTNSLYSIYGSLYGTPSLSNKIYKNNAPYSAASLAWTVPSGFVAIQEIANRPYLAGPEIDNSSNVFAINSSYLFYWDGRNLKAFNKTNGALVGTPLTIAGNLNLMCGGIIADECNNIFVGSTNGTIKVYNFNGSIFDDASRSDISLPGFSNASVYDLAYYEAQKTLFAAGNGFVSSIDVSSYNCLSNSFTVNVSSSCGTLTATASISPTPPVGSTISYVLFQGTTQIASNTSGIFSGLSPNVTYTLKATVNQACSGSVTTTTFVLPGPTITTTQINATCGNADGTINVFATGGLAPYTYSKDGVTFQPGSVFTGLAAGIYTITVRDVNGCSGVIVVNVLNSNGPTVSFTKTDATCGSNTGTITANGSGLAIPLTYSINGINFQTNNFFTGILPGNYTLTAKDTSDCTAVIQVTINNAPAPIVSVVPGATYCNSNNGSITVNATGGTAPLEYSLNANLYQSSNSFSSLAAGSYTVTVRDANGCLSTVSTTIANSAGPGLSTIQTTANCNNANGSISVNGTGGTTPYLYSINGITFQSNNFFSGLTAGNYIVTIKDAVNCTNTVSVTINSTNGPQVTGVSTPSACSSNTGTITASGSGGVGALTYSINGINFQASTLFTALAPNVYTLLVRDVNGCIGAVLVNVTNSAAPTITATMTPTACGVNNGIVTANGLGGTAPYQYSIDGINYQASNIFSGLAIGTYTITIKDFNGCKSTVSTVVTNVAGLSMTISTISSTCIGSTGVINASGSGGLAPLQYSINGVSYQSSGTFSSLSSGNYTVYVKDANGCIVTLTTTIISSSSPQVTAVAVNANCNSSNGSITANGTGGTPPLRYSINGVTYQSSGSFINIAPGTYTVYVKDTVGCIQTTTATITNVGTGAGITTFTVNTRDAYPCNGALGRITNPRVNGSNCNSCTFSLNGGPFISNAAQLYTNLNPGTYTLTAMNANGCTKTIIVTIGAPAVSTASVIVTGTACNTSNGTIKLTGIGPNTPYHSSISGIAGPWITFDPTFTYTGLAPGVYTIIMADDESFDIGPPVIPGGCLDTLTVIVPASGGPVLSTAVSNGSCNLNDGIITASATGGQAPLQYNINGSAYQSSGIFSNLGNGVYITTVLDAGGCINTKIDTIVNPVGGIVSSIVTPVSCGNINGAINVNINGGVAPFAYSINGTIFQNSSVFTGLAAGSYVVRVIDANNCLTSQTVTVSTAPRPIITAYSIAASCNVANGIISANGSSGLAPYQYSLDGITFQSSNLFSGLAAGPYTLTIKDANGCTTTTGVSIGNLSAPALALISTNATCNNANGTITATGSGGTAPLQYSINGNTFQASNVFSGLLPGSYSVTVQDAGGCQSSKNILVTNPNGPQTLNAAIINTSCGNSNGSITATATGGALPLQYSINGTTFQAGTLFSALPATNYTLTVKDANTCTKTINVTINDLPGPLVSAVSTLSSCFANDGTITAQVVGGTGAITYSKNGITFQSSPVFTNLAPATYTITAKDIKGCTNTTLITVNRVQGPTITVTGSNTICGGNIVVTGAGGMTPYQYNLNSQPYQNSNQFICQFAGIYTVRIMDANGCLDSSIVTLSSPLPVQLVAFSGTAEKEFNLLTWTTASEVNNDYFTLERSLDGTNFIKLSEIDGAGNSNQLINYKYEDRGPAYGINYYRLKQTDFNGEFEYSKTIALNSKRQESSYYTYFQESDELLLNLTGGDHQHKTIQLTDASGRMVINTISNENSIRIKTNTLAKGVYSLQVGMSTQQLIFKVAIY